MQMMGTSAPGFDPPSGWNQKEKKRNRKQMFQEKCEFSTLSLFLAKLG
jgi:hypothetical protein